MCNKKRLYFDMDGVLVDFGSGLKQQGASTLKEYEGRHDEIPRLFGVMKPLPEAIDAIRCSEGKISNTATQYEAFYPSSITTQNMVLPANQNYVVGNIENFPMHAVSTNKNLEFKNLCGIIRFCLKSEVNGQLKVSSISLSADKGMSGSFSIGEDNAAVVSGTDGVMLNCTEAEQLYATSSTDFNIIIPQGVYNPLKVKICDAEGKEVNLVSEGAITIKRSEITRITLTLAKSTFETSLETIPITDSNVDFTER